MGEVSSNITKHFKWSEFVASDGTEVPEEYKPNVIMLCEQLEIIRSYIEAPLIITCGYRTPETNKACGGSDNSQHLYAAAVDLKSHLYSPAELAREIHALAERGMIVNGGIGFYKKTHVHYDIGYGMKRPKRRWPVEWWRDMPMKIKRGSA